MVRPGRHVRRKLDRRGEVGLQGLEVPVVDADQGRAQPQGPFELGTVVHLGQHVHPAFLRRRLELGGERVVQRGQDQQHAIGAHRPAFQHLPRVEHEILAQHWKLDRRPH